MGADYGGEAAGMVARSRKLRTHVLNSEYKAEKADSK